MFADNIVVSLTAKWTVLLHGPCAVLHCHDVKLIPQFHAAASTQLLVCAAMEQVWSKYVPTQVDANKRVAVHMPPVHCIAGDIGGSSVLLDSCKCQCLQVLQVSSSFQLDHHGTLECWLEWVPYLHSVSTGQLFRKGQQVMPASTCSFSRRPDSLPETEFQHQAWNDAFPGYI